MHSSRRFAATFLLSLAALAAGTICAAAKGSKPEASFPAREGRSLLVFECGDEKAVWLRVWHPVRGWRPDLASEVRIGPKVFRTEVDGATDSFLLSDVPLPGMGLTDALLSAAKEGSELVLAGPAARQIPGPRRSFPLTDARAKIARVERACGHAITP